MKRICVILLATLTSVCIAVDARDLEAELAYAVNPDGASVTVTGPTREFKESITADDTYYAFIPASIKINGIEYPVTKIGDEAFSKNGNITDVLIPMSVTEIGKRAFRGNICFSFVTIPNSVTTIGDGAFEDTGLNLLELGNSVTTIGERAFADTYLEVVDIPGSVTSIGRGAFCCGLTDANSHITNPEGVCQGDIFADNDVTLHVPAGLADRYRNAQGWNSSYIVEFGQPVAVSLLTLNAEHVDLAVGDRYQLKATVQPSGADNKNLTWSSSDESVATVDVRGLVTAVALGTATITATTTDGSNLSASCEACVKIFTAESISLDRTSLQLFEGETATLEATVQPERTDNKTVAWSSGDESVVTVDDNGTVTAVGAGMATITATTTDGTNLSADCMVTVRVDKTSYQDITMVVEMRMSLEESGWWSSNPDVVDVERDPTSHYNYYAVAYSPGTAILYGPYHGNQREAYNVTVVNLPPGYHSGFTEIEPSEVTLTEGETIALDFDADDYWKENCEWSSSDNAVATVNDRGVVTAVSAGTATIRVSFYYKEGVCGDCEVTVLPLNISAESISLDHSELSLTEGETATLTATVLPEDTTDKGVTWSSSDTSVATVENGVVTAVAAGTATITATTTDGSYLTASCQVTVNKRIITTDNVLAAADLAVTTGSEFAVTVGMTNQASITAVQCDVYLPQGLQFITDGGDYVVDLITDRVSRNHSVSTSDMSDGGVRVLIASQTSKPITGSEGDLFTLSLIAPDGIAAGDYVINIRNIILSDVDTKLFYAPEVNVTVAVSDYTPGDVNGDKTINVGDYVATANYILMKDPQPFIFAAADIDGNGTINVGDLVAVANLALHYEGAPRMAAAVALPQSLSAMLAAPRTVAVHTGGTAALQLDVTLPAGMTLAAASAGGHSAEVARLADGGWRVLVSSPMARDISGDVTLTLEGDSEGDAVLHGIIAADTQGNTTAYGDIVLPIGTTGIGDIAADGLRDATLYDLHGRRVVNPTPGIYVSNGRKIIVR